MGRISIPLLLACLALPGFGNTPAAPPSGKDTGMLLNGFIPEGSARQSSRYKVGGPESAYGEANQALAMDETTLKAVNARGYAFHTNREKNAWWTVDLGAPFLLDHARIVNRQDCCQARAATLEIYVSNEPFTGDPRSWPRAKKVFPIDDRPVGTFDTLASANLSVFSDGQAVLAAGQALAVAAIRGDPKAIGAALDEVAKAKAQAAKRYVGIRLAGTDNLHLKRVEFYGWN